MANVWFRRSNVVALPRSAGRRAARTRIGVSVIAVVVCLAATPGVGQAADGGFRPGAPGLGDTYVPLSGNGGYDVRHYLLDVAYQPRTDVLTGVATITARATQSLSRFNLDLIGLTVRSVMVNGRPARWTRDGGELTVVPGRGLPRGTTVTTVVRYDGVPQTINDPSFGPMGFIHTDDGAIVAGAPHGAATWFPANDHPVDKASYTIRVRVPEGLEAIGNGVLRDRVTRAGWTTWTWEAREPMAPYLATATIGDFDLRAYREDGIRYWDAIDPDLFAPLAEPRTGSRFAISQVSELPYKRLSRTIPVPAAGAELSFWITRDTEPTFDFVFVEAHTVGADDWTTLPDRNGHTGPGTGQVCPYWLGLHPFLTHYQTAIGDGSCTATGTTGSWSAATGASDGYEQWSVDLSGYAGRDVEVSISFVGDEIIQFSGVFVDDITVSTGAGTTSFEADGDTFDGWTVPGPPAGSAPNADDWISGTAADTPPSLGTRVEQAFARQGEIVEFLAENFGPYPFSAAGGIVDANGIGFGMEVQTRPIYSQRYFRDLFLATPVIVHEMAHQWFGDSLTVASWRHVWLNEGFARYAEWLWYEQEGLVTAQEFFDFYSGIPADDPIWAVTIGDPGPADIFDNAIYLRGALTLQRLRMEVGDETFFAILHRWTSTRAGGNVTTDQFIAVAEQVSGRQLDALFTTWLFTATRPEPATISIDVTRRTRLLMFDYSCEFHQVVCPR